MLLLKAISFKVNKTSRWQPGICIVREMPPSSPYDPFIITEDGAILIGEIYAIKYHPHILSLELSKLLKGIKL